jgi:hypothetical protein
MSINKNGYTRYDRIAMRGIEHNLYQPGKDLDKYLKILVFFDFREIWRENLPTYLSRKTQKDIFVFDKINIFVCF